MSNGAGEESAAPVHVGDVLAGRYRVDRVLGSGGMGVVVAATHVELGQRVALKFLLPAALTNAEAVARFVREARAAVRIESEHVARVTDVGRLDTGAPYIVMEYLDGRDLSQYPKGNQLPIETAVDFVLQACEAIAVAHSLGIVHRDLKPANLFLTTRPDGSPLVKVLDFGISKLMAASQASVDLTRPSAVIGSPLYMSPEQIQSARNVDMRTDVWSLGVILHDLLSGSPPFQGETLAAVFVAVMNTETPRVRALRPEVPEGLEEALLRALEKDPQRRFANVGEFACALAPFAPERSRLSVDRVLGVLERSGVSRSSPPSAPRSMPADNLVGATRTSWGDPLLPEVAAKGSPRKPIWILALVTLVLGSLAAGLALRFRAPAAVPSASVARPAASSAVLETAPRVVAVEVAAPGPSALGVDSSAPAQPELSSLLPSAAPSARPGSKPAPAHGSPNLRPASPQAAAASRPFGEPTTKQKNPLAIEFK